MAEKITVTIILFSLLISIVPRPVHGLVSFDPDAGTSIGEVDSISCTGFWYTKLLCTIKKVADYIKTIQKIAKLLTYIPHSFPFGGPILKSERACVFHMRSITWIGVQIGPVWFPVPGYFPVDVPLAGRAIVVGPPVPTYPEPPSSFIFSGNNVPPGGWVIAFPWISKIYRNHAENRAGPWSLGLGFSPFPLQDLNDALGEIKIWIPPTLIDRDCMIPDPSWYGRVGFLAECVDNFSFDCKESGEKDPQGNDIYKVIRLMGTSKENAPARAFPTGFPLP